MKRLLILSLLMMQGLWGAPAADMPASVTVQTNDGQALELELGDYVFFRTITNMLQGLPEGDDPIPLDVSLSDIVTIVNLCKQIRDNNGLLQQSPDWINNPVILGNVIRGAVFLDVMIDPAREHDGSAMFVTALYIAWLNLPANHTQPIIGRQTVHQACIAMGMQNPPAEWDQIFVDVSDHLHHDITSLHTRPGTIAHLVHTGQMPVVVDGKLNLLQQGLTVCDAWSIPNPQTIIFLDLYYNQITTLTPGVFVGLGALEVLDLSYNQITTLVPGVFVGLDALIRLDLHNNQITALAPGVFAELRKLKSLYIADNPELQLNYPNNLVSIKEQRPEWFEAPQAGAAAADAAG